ncbi:MAG: cell division protein FtsA [Gemmatimonadota bacterium]
MRPNLVAGLDIGSTKTCGVIAEATTDAAGEPTLKILGVGQSRTAGMRRETVTDIDGTTESVRTAIQEAELMAGVSVDRVTVGIAGEHIEADGSTGVVAVTGEEIRSGDVKRVQEVARTVAVPNDREVLHVLPQEYIVDRQEGIRDPVGMAGTRLEANVYIVTSAIKAGRNLRKAVGRAGYEIEALVYEPLATALAVLTEDELDVGVALVDLGGGATDVGIFRGGKMRHLTSIPWGGVAVTNDIAQGLKISAAEAERAKEKFGVAFAQLVDPREKIELPGPSPDTKRSVPRELIAHIIEQRLDEILELVTTAIEEAGETESLGAGVVLTGGGASLEGTIEVAQHVFGRPVRVGVPEAGLSGLSDSVRQPRFSAATGLALYTARNRRAAGTVSRLRDGAVARVVAWLKEFF